jgi:hypothetical protein
MPYILPERRIGLNDTLNKIKEDIKQDKLSSAGDLNYLLTMTMHEYLNTKGLNYANCNELIGMLECAKLELYRRVVGKYEDKKINENGDV